MDIFKIVAPKLGICNPVATKAPTNGAPVLAEHDAPGHWIMLGSRSSKQPRFCTSSCRKHPGGTALLH